MNKLYLLAVLLIFAACKNKDSKNITTVENTEIAVISKDTMIEEEKTVAITDNNTVIETIIEEVEKAPEPEVKKNKVLKNETITNETKKVTEEIKEKKETVISKSIDIVSSKTSTDIIKTKNEVTIIPEKTEKETIIEVAPVVKEKKQLKTITKVNHDAWDNLLTKYVSKKGNVDYKNFANNSSKLNDYLNYLATNSPKSNWTKNEKLAYYINIYNAATVKLILDNYPTKSIKNLKSPWGKKIVKIGSELVSLGDIEHKILRKMGEPRIHFAINCASYSCPKLLNSAFKVATMEQQLELATKDFVNDTTRNIISENNIQLSEIFKWYKKDFTNKTNLITYINKYSKIQISSNTKINYKKYDWSLNERK